MQPQRAKDRWGHILLQDECWKNLTPLAAIALALVSVSLCYRYRCWRPKNGSVALREFCFLNPNTPRLLFLLLWGYLELWRTMTHNGTQRLRMARYGTHTAHNGGRWRTYSTQWHMAAHNGTQTAHCGTDAAHNGTRWHTMAHKWHAMAHNGTQQHAMAHERSFCKPAPASSSQTEIAGAGWTCWSGC